ncbi:uncharacterized protein LOC129598437 [Paramacrobiotus metropolitanus]|uniref:uncharacterized protein LOC129598437 n=1 Tax=Paramacrobiotus metropolitanus TaxID=2943436 RepID=UPI0024463C33|nr:uncharacterized protein LOC129598437 [Paramacrobiotus metropolitanus]XP_055352315.1 uncharacterized protein LOC129598437 [Paramacrobiotus metropolitanus]
MPVKAEKETLYSDPARQMYDPVFDTLLIINCVISFVLLPLSHFKLDGCIDADRWIRHRNNCGKCSDFEKRFCTNLPCWLCEFSWSTKHFNLCCYDKVSPSYMPPEANKILSPVPFFATSLPQEGFRHKRDFAVLDAKTAHGLELSTGASELLCHSHKAEYRQRPAPNRTDSDVDFRASWTSSKTVTSFLQQIYTPNALPLQLWFRAVMCDQGVTDRHVQNEYWLLLKQIREEHKSCGQECVLNRGFITISQQLRMVIRKLDSQAGSSWQNLTFTLDKESPHCMAFAQFFFLHHGEQFPRWPARKCPGLKASEIRLDATESANSI